MPRVRRLPHIPTAKLAKKYPPKAHSISKGNTPSDNGLVLRIVYLSRATMIAALEAALVILKALSLLLATLTALVWGFSVALRKKLSDILLRWEKPQFGLWTAIFFLGGLGFVSAGMLSYAFAIKYDAQPELFQLWRTLSLLCFGFVMLLGVLYMGLRYQFVQPLSERGFYQIRFDWQRFAWEVEFIPWERVYDYFTQSDGVLITFTLLLRDRRKVVFSVPQHLRETVERVVDFSTDKYGFLHTHGQRIARSRE